MKKSSSRSSSASVARSSASSVAAEPWRMSLLVLCGFCCALLVITLLMKENRALRAEVAEQAVDISGL